MVNSYLSCIGNSLENLSRGDLSNLNAGYCYAELCSERGGQVRTLRRCTAKIQEAGEDKQGEFEVASDQISLLDVLPAKSSETD